MDKLKRLYNVVSDFLEVWVPSISFVVVFVTYVIMIIYRYLFNAQINWIYELSMIAFVWTVVLSASYCSRTDNHIAFTMLYDLLPERGRLIMRVLGNLAIVALMTVLLPHAFEAVSFLKIKKSSLLLIPFNIIYAPFLVFNILTILHHLIELVRDVTALLTGKAGPGEEMK